MSKGYQFGEGLEMIAASESNPIKYGYFVRRGFNSGRVNSGPFIEMTDAKGNFWKTPPDNVRRTKMQPPAQFTAQGTRIESDNVC